MTRNEFIEIMEAYVSKLQNERKEIREQAAKDDWNAYHMINKINHEISTINNAIREMKRQ